MAPTVELETGGQWTMHSVVTAARWPSIVLPVCWPILQSPCWLAEHPIPCSASFPVHLMGNASFLWKLNEALHLHSQRLNSPTQVAPEGSSPMNGSLVLMLPSVCAPAPFHTLHTSTAWFLPAQLRWLLFLSSFPFYRGGNPDIMAVVTQLGDGLEVACGSLGSETCPARCTILHSLNTSSLFLPSFSSEHSSLRVFHLLMRSN